MQLQGGVGHLGAACGEEYQIGGKDWLIDEEYLPKARDT